MSAITDHLLDIAERLSLPGCTEDDRLEQAQRLRGIVDALRTGKGPQRRSPSQAPVAGRAYTVTQAAQKLGMTYREVRAMVDAGRLPSFVVPHSGRTLIPIAAVERILRDRDARR